ncbi:MAG: Xaa-Pro peptidase family protein [Oscillospiraceae bacterium]|nr:Xaa-Pro peptidase family protein [Oscillospiraceae bacterium]
MTRLQALAGAMPPEIDCFLITSDINRRYFTGFKSSAGMLAVFRNTSYLLIDFRYYEKAKSTVTDCSVIKSETQYKQLAKLFEKHGVKTIGIEAQKLTIAGLNLMQKAFKGLEINTSSVLSEQINAMRAVKSAEELEKIKAAQAIAERAFDFLLGLIKPGVTEKRLAYLLNDYILKNAEALSFNTIVISGANTSLPHGEPTDKEVKKGEFIMLDFGAVFEGYHSDMTRTVALGAPDGEMSQVYELVLMAQKAALEKIKAGVKCREFDSSARRVITDGGYGKCFGHGLGHGVGLEVHEKPNANQRDKSKFSAGNVITCEPGIYIPGKFGVRIEDMAYVTAEGHENLTKAHKGMMII